MKIGLPVLLGAFIVGAGCAATAAHAVTLPSKAHVASTATEVTFWVEHEKKKHHAHRAFKKHRVAPPHKHWKKKEH